MWGEILLVCVFLLFFLGMYGAVFNRMPWQPLFPRPISRKKYADDKFKENIEDARREIQQGHRKGYYSVEILYSPDIDTDSIEVYLMKKGYWTSVENLTSNGWDRKKLTIYITKESIAEQRRLYEEKAQ